MFEWIKIKRRMKKEVFEWTHPTKRIKHAVITPCVVARELHEEIGVKKSFSNWVKQWTKWGFVENKDFRRISKKVFYVDIPMSKDLYMLENNKRGKVGRKYYRECEKKLRDSDPAGYNEIADKIKRELQEIE